MNSSSSAYEFGVLCEAESDQKTACGLAERVLLEQISWLDQEQLTEICCWKGLEPDRHFMTWSSVEKHAKEQGIRARGSFSGKFDARRTRMALLLWNSLERCPDAVLIARDTDNEKERMPSIEDVARQDSWPFTIVLAMAHVKRECWILNGFDPQNDQEKAALQAAQKKLGFDPREKAEKLTGSGKSPQKNAKKVLKEDLDIAPNSPREDACWQETDLDLLRSRGEKTLLTKFLQEVSDRLVPVIAPR